MPNMSLKKVKMPELAPTTRNRNYEEVTMGYSPEMAMEEASRCLNCKHKPCVSGCPVEVNIPEFIKQVSNGDFLDAYETITNSNTLPAVCGRVCPQESQCEEVCVRAIKGESVGIGRLERFVADYKMNTEQNEEFKKSNKNGHKVAVVGSGPSGLSCAGDLARLGYDVTIFEAFHTAGGVLVYGIPEFRLPKQIVADEIERLKELGVEIKTNMVIGRVLSIDELKDMGYESIYIGTGAGLPRFMGIPGEEFVGVYSANEYLTRINLMKAYKEDYDTPIRKSKSVAVIGGGNVAMDAARSAKRLGADHVYIVYRRNRDQMPARLEEIHHAEQEGITFKLLNNPIKIVGDDNGEVTALECTQMELGDTDASGRPRPVAIDGSNFQIKVDTVIVSIGSSPNPLIKSTTEGLETNKRGCMIVDDQMATTKDGVYAGGDAVTGAATVINAMGAGKVAAKAIDEYIMSREVNNKKAI